MKNKTRFLAFLLIFAIGISIASAQEDLYPRSFAGGPTFKTCDEHTQFNDYDACTQACKTEGCGQNQMGCYVCPSEKYKIVPPPLFIPQDVAKRLYENLDKLSLNKTPASLRFLLGKPKINIKIELANGSELIYGFKIAGNKIQEFQEGGLEKPHYIITVPEKSIMSLILSNNPYSKAQEMYINGEIKVEPQRLGAKIKFWFAEKFLKWFGKSK